VLEHAADELLELQLLVLVLVAHVVHLRHHCSQVNLNQIEKTIGPGQTEVRETLRREGRQVVISHRIGEGRGSCFKEAEFTLIRPIRGVEGGGPSRSSVVTVPFLWS
jgi:hypothetical protein